MGCLVMANMQWGKCPKADSGLTIPLLGTDSTPLMVNDPSWINYKPPSPGLPRDGHMILQDPSESFPGTLLELEGKSPAWWIISPEGTEIKFPEESPLAVRRSTTIRGRRTDKTQRVPQASGPAAGVVPTWKPWPTQTLQHQQPGTSFPPRILQLSSSLPGLSPAGTTLKYRKAPVPRGSPQSAREESGWISARPPQPALRDSGFSRVPAKSPAAQGNKLSLTCVLMAILASLFYFPLHPHNSGEDDNSGERLLRVPWQQGDQTSQP